jgi:hypothetical protein
VRTSSIIADTTVGGRVLWLVRDSLRVDRYEERFADLDHSSREYWDISRTASGITVGRYLYDPVLRLPVWRKDTTSLSGSATLRLPDGRTYTTVAGFERIRRLDVRDSAGHAAVQLSAGLRPLLAVPAVTASAKERLVLRDLVPATLARWLQVIADPGHNFERGLLGENPVSAIAGQLLSAPIVIARDSTQLPCGPDVCAALAALWDTSTDERLRDIGLITRFTTDPLRWRDTLLARGAMRPEWLTSAVNLARVVVSVSESAAKAPLPGPAADWHDWYEWMWGTNPAYQPPVGVPPITFEGGVRFGASHATALRFGAAMSGRDIISEVQQLLNRAPNDSARLVLERILIGLDMLPLTGDEVAQAYLARSTGMALLAARARLDAFMSARAEPADSQTVKELVSRAVNAALYAAPLWPALGNVSFTRCCRVDTLISDRYLLATNLPSAILSELAGRLRMVDTSFRSPLPGARAELISFGPIVRAGPFVRLAIRFTKWQGISTREVSRGVTMVLLQVNGEWHVITATHSVS